MSWMSYDPTAGIANNGDGMTELSIGVSPGLPLYQEVKRRIFDVVRRGDWKPGDAIPSEKRLAERFGVSIGTLRKAVDELVSENLLVRRQGRGTFVTTHNESRYIYSFFHVLRHDGHKEPPEVQLVSFDRVKADAYAASMLGVEVGASLFRIVNLLKLGGMPVDVDEIHLPASLFRGLTEKRARERKITLYQLYQVDFGVTVLRTEERMRAVKADATTAALLAVARGDPLLKVIRRALSFNDMPVELRFSYISTARHEYNSEPVALA
jgi:GntR family transcriptional regulator